METRQPELLTMIVVMGGHTAFTYVENNTIFLYAGSRSILVYIEILHFTYVSSCSQDISYTVYMQSCNKPIQGQPQIELYMLEVMQPVCI